MIHQKTLKDSISISGVGLHTGEKVNVVIKPAQANEGVTFIRTDLNNASIPMNISTIVCEESVSRCTVLKNGDAQVATVEHLVSALAGLGVSNVVIEVDGPEIPGLDGSSLEFVEAINKVGLVELDAPQEFIEIKDMIGVSKNGASIFIVPSNDFKVSYTLSYDHPLLRSQYFSTEINEEVYTKEVAGARTFCLEEEVEAIKEKGLGKGADYSNNLVLSEDGPIENTLRFDDECARHKVLDCVGDLYLMGLPIRGHVYACKSGHRLNHELLKKIAKHKETADARQVAATIELPEGEDVPIQDIMKILPHRYPILLIDRVVVVEKGKRAVGIKNVTINDGFFQGHFPDRPIMPGVLMVEAMAQTCGIVALTSDNHRGKLAFFMGVDNVKFRKLVEPGDQLVMEIEVTRDRSRTSSAHGIGKVNGEVVVEADMSFSFTDPSVLD